MYIPTYSRTCRWCGTTVSVQDDEMDLDTLMARHWRTLLCQAAVSNAEQRRHWWSWR